MKNIEIKIVHSATLKLLFKKRNNILFFFKKVERKLVGQNIRGPGITGRQAFFDGQLTLAVNVAVGGVEVVEASVDEGVHHVAGLGDVHFPLLHREAHQTEAKVLFDLGKNLLHIILSAFLYEKKSLAKESESLS